jgi:hypothetical protein
MIRVLHAEHAFSDRFISYMLGRNIRIEEDLVDQLFNSTEKRLARTLLLLARYGKQDQPQKMLPKVSREMLAEMIGTAFAGQSFHEQIQEIGLHSLQWRASHQQFALEWCPARMIDKFRAPHSRTGPPADSMGIFSLARYPRVICGPSSLRVATTPF